MTSTLVIASASFSLLTWSFTSLVLLEVLFNFFKSTLRADGQKFSDKEHSLHFGLTGKQIVYKRFSIIYIFE